MLTSAAAVRALSPEEAGRGLPARLRGVILLVSTQANALVLFDRDEGIYVELPRPPGGAWRPGDEFEIEGVSAAGDFAPIVRAREARRLGPGVLPPPVPVTIAELSAGGYDAAWVELRGIVRSCTPVTLPPPLDRAPPRRDRWLVVAQGGDTITVTVQNAGPLAPEEWVDAEVRLKAVVFNVHNANRQFVRAHLRVANRDLVEVTVPPPAEPFALPVQPIGELLRFSRTGFTGHRVRVQGVVTAHRPGDALWVRDGERGLRVESAQEGTLAPGDQVDLVGFPEHGGYTPSLRDAIFRRRGQGPAPVPHVLGSADDISRYESNLVELSAELREIRPAPDAVELVLDWQGSQVRAQLPTPLDAAMRQAWQPGSAVRVTGICLVGQADPMLSSGRWVAKNLRILLRTAEDVAVVRAAPWWTTQRMLQVMVSVLVFALAALILVAVFARRQIAQREASRKLAEAEFAAMLAERNRLAREIHDTLAQDLNAVSMQLELARNSARTGPDAVLPFVSGAHQIVRKCLAEARESIWNMRSHILERTDLADALLTVARQLGAGTRCEIRSRVVGHPRRLAPLVENNLLRIGQEAVSNALKHARPRLIEIELGFGNPEVRLTVRDDGPGFDPDTGESDGSHFGLRGMRERVRQMNGTLHLGRDTAGGTRLEVIVAVPEPA